jgi:hypothetical protein
MNKEYSTPPGSGVILIIVLKKLNSSGFPPASQGKDEKAFQIGNRRCCLLFTVGEMSD